MTGSIILFQLFGESMAVTAYSLILTLGVLAGMALLLIRAKDKASAMSLAAAAAIGALLGGRILYCVTKIGFILGDYDLGFIVRPWEGGYTMFGAIWGGMAAIWLYARCTKKNVWEQLDLAAPAAALVMAIGRAGEYFSSQGMGKYLDEGFFSRFPFGIQNDWEEWQIPVFMYEALAALVIAIVLLTVCRKAKAGTAAKLFVVLISLTQIICDSWRADDFIRFGFVHLNQLCAAVCLAVVGGVSVWQKSRESGFKGWQIARVVMFVLGVGIIVGLEFALDKTAIDDAILYVIMMLTLGMMGTAVLKENK